MVGMLMIFKTRWLIYIYFLIDVAIQEGTLAIHLEEFETTHTSKGQQQPHNLQPCNRGKGFTIIYALLLIVAFGN